MVSILLSLEEEESHGSSDEDHHASHHLVDTGRAHSEGNVHEGGSAGVARCGDRHHYGVDGRAQLGLLGLLHSGGSQHVLSSVFRLFLQVLAVQLLYAIYPEAQEFAEEHNRTLDIWLVEFFLLIEAVLGGRSEGLVLHFHEDGVGGACGKHEDHDAVEAEAIDLVLLFTH